MDGLIRTGERMGGGYGPGGSERAAQYLDWLFTIYYGRLSLRCVWEVKGREG